ncbi:uncharacterized protein ACO6RY_08934 [Pungitius sinensis]
MDVRKVLCIREVCTCWCLTLVTHRHVTISSHAAIGWHLWGSVKKSFSDSTQVPKGVAGDWEKDNVGGTRRWHHHSFERRGSGM